MFFRANFGHCNIDSLLDKLQNEEEGIHLNNFLDDEDLLSECRSDNERLLDYLSKEENIKALLEYCISLPTDENLSEEESAKLYKYSFVSSEVLSSEVTKISDALLDYKDFPFMFSSFLDSEKIKIAPIIAEYGAKVFCALLRKNNAKFIKILEANSNILDNLINNISVVSIADIFVKLLDSNSSEHFYGALSVNVSSEAITLLSRQDLLNTLCKTYIQSISDSSIPIAIRHSTIENIANVILGISLKIIEIAQTSIPVPTQLSIFHCPGPFIEMFNVVLPPENDDIKRIALFHIGHVAYELMTTETNVALEEPEGKPSSLTEQNIISSMIRSMSPPRRAKYLGKSPEKEASEIVAKSRKSEGTVVSTATLEAGLRSLLKPLLEFIHDEKLNDDPVETSDKRRRVGILEMEVIQLLVGLFDKGSDATREVMIDLGIPKILLTLFFEKHWHNILHCTVSEAIVKALDSDSKTRQIGWLNTGLVKMLIETWHDYSQKVESKWVEYNGYQGHSVKLAQSLKYFFEKVDDQTDEYISKGDLEEFYQFYENKVVDVVEIQGRALGGEKPPQNTSPSSDDDFFFEELNDFDLDDVIEGMTSGDNNAVNKFAEYLFQTGRLNTNEEQRDILINDEAENLELELRTSLRSDDGDDSEYRLTPFPEEILASDADLTTKEHGALTRRLTGRLQPRGSSAPELHQRKVKGQEMNRVSSNERSKRREGLGMGSNEAEPC